MPQRNERMLGQLNMPNHHRFILELFLPYPGCCSRLPLVYDAQTTVHPMVMYFKDSGEVKHQNICFMSEYLTHNTIRAYVLQKVAMSSLKEIY